MGTIKRNAKLTERKGAKTFDRSGSRGRFSDRRVAEKTLYRATCNECKKFCEVPFKPNGKKPVLCNACFGKDNFSDQKREKGRNFDRPSFGDRRRFDRDTRDSNGAMNDQIAEQLKMINDKLNIILRTIG